MNSSNSRLGSPTSPATPVPSSTDAPDGDDFDEDDLPECEDDQDQQAQPASETAYVRRGRGQHWQRSLDSEFIKLDRSYIPHAPAPDRRSRRRAVTQVSPTSTGL